MTHTVNVKFEETRLTVDFDYQPAEPMTHDYPGCAEEVELIAVWHHDEDILPMLNDDAIEKISRTVIKSAEQEDEYSSEYFYRVWGAAA